MDKMDDDWGYSYDETETSICYFDILHPHGTIQEDGADGAIENFTNPRFSPDIFPDFSTIQVQLQHHVEAISKFRCVRIGKKSYRNPAN